MKQMYSTSLAVINTESLIGSGGDVPSIQRETLENVYKKKSLEDLLNMKVFTLLLNQDAPSVLI